VRWLLLGAACAVALAGCETTAERSAQLERQAKQREAQAQRRSALAGQAPIVKTPSRYVKVVATAVVHDSEGTAAIVTLHNGSATAYRQVPVAITVRDAAGRIVYRNNSPGQEVTLVSAPLIPAHGTVSWVNDQVQATGTPASVTAEVGEGTSVKTAPSLSVVGLQTVSDPTTGESVDGTVLNSTAGTSPGAVVYAVGRRGGRIVAAGRAVLPQAPAASRTPFQLFLVGDRNGPLLRAQALPISAG
jgi:hypothetical protein